MRCKCKGKIWSFVIRATCPDRDHTCLKKLSINGVLHSLPVLLWLPLTPDLPVESSVYPTSITDRITCSTRDHRFSNQPAQPQYLEHLDNTGGPVDCTLLWISIFWFKFWPSSNEIACPHKGLRTSKKPNFCPRNILGHEVGGEFGSDKNSRAK